LRSIETPLAGAQFVTEQDGGSDVGAIETEARANADGTWAITGETRPYDHSCGCFGQLQPSRSLSFRHGGAGAFEVGARYSKIDLTSGAVDGGKFDRWSGAFSWFPTNEFRFEFNYGYGTMERFGIRGRTRFYQLRLQWEI